MRPILRRIFPPAASAGRAKVKRPSGNRRCAGCATRQPAAAAYRHCGTCGEYQPTGATLGLDPIAAFWGLATALLLGLGCSAMWHYAAAAAAEEWNPPWHAQPWVIGIGGGLVVYYAVVTGQRIARGEWAAALDFAITFAIAAAVNTLINGNPVIGWSYTYFIGIPVNGIYMPLVYGAVRRLRRLLKQRRPEAPTEITTPKIPPPTPYDGKTWQDYAESGGWLRRPK